MTADTGRRTALELTEADQRKVKQISAAYDDKARMETLQGLGIDYIALKSGGHIYVANFNNDLRGAIDAVRFGNTA